MKKKFTANSFFKYLSALLFVLIFLFLTSPILMLVIKGVPAISECLKSKETLFSIFLSLKTSLVSTAICIMLTIPAAYFISKIKKFKILIIQIICIPMSLPHIVSGIALLLLFGRMGAGEFLSRYLKVDFIFTVYGIILAQIFVNLPFALKQAIIGFESINEKKLFVAKNLGCNDMQVFWFIIMPAVKDILLSIIVMTWARSLGEYGAVIMIAGVTKMKTEIIPTSIMLNISTGELEQALGVSVILFIISISCTIIFECLFNKQKKRGGYA